MINRPNSRISSIARKQTLIPLTPLGGTVIFKNKFYGNSTNFTINKEVSIPTKCKIEFVAEGQELSKTDDLAKTLIEYGDKMNG